ncbi:MAG: hypothetical protein C0594_16635 [Marinilabiliales bacterium]|nr:MAG: hypothetical protein C0594_16635 [Marinilabiliales bacterium]
MKSKYLKLIKLTVSCIFILTGQLVFSQHTATTHPVKKSESNYLSINYFQSLFDSLGWDRSEGYSTRNNQTAFGWAESIHLESLLNMYEATKDVKYLQTLILCIGNTIDRRDDERYKIGLDSIVNNRGISGPFWSTSHYNAKGDTSAPKSHLIHSANIVYSFARLASTIKLDSSLQDLIVQKGRYKNLDFDSLANVLINEAGKTIQAHDFQWKRRGYYKHQSSRKELPFNYQASAGKVILHLYLASKDEYYYDKLIALSERIKKKYLTYNPGLDCYEWNYSRYQEGTDISHGGLSSSFAYECYKYRISFQGEPVFSQIDMLRFSNTFMKKIYDSPWVLNDGMNNDAEAFDFKNSDPFITGNIGNTIRWIQFSEFNEEVYQIIAELYSSSHLARLKPFRPSAFELSQLELYAPEWIPVCSNKSFSDSSDWQNMAICSLINSNQDDVFAYKKVKQELYKFNLSSNNRTLNHHLIDSNLNWNNFDAFYSKVDSCIVFYSLMESNNNQYLIKYKLQNDSLYASDTLANFGQNKKWKGIKSGPLVQSDITDIIMVNEKADSILIFNNSIQSPKQLKVTEFTNNAQVVDFECKDIDTDSLYDLIFLVKENSTYKFMIYTISDSLEAKLYAQFEDTINTFTNLTCLNNPKSNPPIIAAINKESGNINFYEMAQTSISLLSTIEFEPQQTNGSIMVSGNIIRNFKNDEIILLKGKDGKSSVSVYSASRPLIIK